MIFNDQIALSGVISRHYPALVFLVLKSDIYFGAFHASSGNFAFTLYRRSQFC